MDYASSVVIDAPARRVWEVYSDVARWPEWMETVSSVRLLDDGPLRIGSRVRIKQPRLRAAVWQVTEWADGRYFAWVSTSPGIRITGGHRVEVTDAGTVASSTIRQEGPFSWLADLLLGRLINRYLAIEGTSLKTRSEQL